MNTQDLRRLLDTITGGNAEKSVTALKLIEGAIEDYRRDHPILDGGRRRKPSVSAARAALNKLDKKLTDALELTKHLPIAAHSSFCRTYEAPLGRLAKELKRGIDASKGALQDLGNVPDRQRDHSAEYLAWRVARVFVDILGTTPTATRDDAPHINFKRHGAAYARVLRSALAIAGRQNVDIAPLVDAGLSWLKDPSLPQD